MAGLFDVSQDLSITSQLAKTSGGYQPMNKMLQTLVQNVRSSLDTEVDSSEKNSVAPAA